MNKSKSLKTRFLNWVNPIENIKWFFRWTTSQMREHKIITTLVVIFTFFETAYCINLQPLANFFENGGLLMDDTINNLTVDLYEIGTYTDLIYQAVVPVGQALAVLIWIIGLGEIAMRDDLTPEMIVKDFLKIIIILIVIGNYGWDIISGLTYFFNEVIELVRGTGIGDADMSGVAVTGGNFASVPLGKLGMSLLAIGLLSGLKIYLNVAVAVVVYTRKIKLIVYAVLSPMGLYDFRDGFHSQAANYIRKYCALCMQGVIMVVTNKLASDLLVALLTGGLTVGASVADSLMTLIKVAPLIIVLISFMKSTEQIASDVIGAH